MSEDEANAALLVLLLFDRRDWPAAQVEAWRQAIRQYGDAQAALDASDALINGSDPRDWSLHRWRQAYEGAMTRRPVLTLIRSTERVISLSEHMSRLAERAERGDEHAAEEHALFTRYRHLFDAGFPIPEEEPW